MKHLEPRKPQPDLPPHNPTAELVFLAACVENRDALAALDVSLFFSGVGIAIAEAMIALRREGRRVEEVELLHRLPLETFIELNKALSEGLPPSNWRYWLALLDELRAARQTAAIEVELSEARRRVAEGGTADLQAIARKLHALESSRRLLDFDMCAELGHIIDGLEAVSQDPRRAYGINVPLPTVNERLLGLHGGRLYCIAARPGVGKTAMLAQIATSAVCELKPTLFFSLEMNRGEILRRCLQILYGVSCRAIETNGARPEDFRRFGEAHARLRDLPFIVDDSASTLKQIIERAEDAARQHRAALVCVDYVQRVKIPGWRDNRVALLTEITGALKDFALRHNVPVLVAAQLSRAHESENRLPGLSDLKDSGSIEQDSDAVLLLHSTRDTPEETKLLICKNRQGPGGVIKLRFDRTCTRFEEL